MVHIASMSKFEHHAEALRETGIYDTPQESRATKLRIINGLRYHLDIMRLVVSAGNDAKKGNLDQTRWMDAAWTALHAVERAGGKVSFRGFNQAADLGMPVVWAANHMSTVETMVLPCAMTPFSPVSIVLKESLLKYPFFGHVLRALKPIEVNRKDPREDLRQVMEQGVARLKSGRSVLIFPQATRSRELSRSRFNTLAVKLARRGGVPLVPVALRTDFAGVGRMVRDVGPVDPSKPVIFSCGKPIDASDQRAAHAECFAFIEKHFREWGLPVVD